MSMDIRAAGMIDKNEGTSSSGASGCGGFTLGAFLAIILSWKVNQSFLYAFLHGILGWFYVIYWLIAHYHS